MLVTAYSTRYIYNVHKDRKCLLLQSDGSLKNILGSHVTLRGGVKRPAEANLVHLNKCGSHSWEVYSRRGRTSDKYRQKRAIGLGKLTEILRYSRPRFCTGTDLMDETK